MESDAIIHGDCLEVLPTLPDHSIDMILCDLPYGKGEEIWDELLPMGVLWREYRRILQPRGAIVLTSAQPFTSLLITSNPKWFRHTWIWDKGAGIGLTANKRPIQVHEDVVVFGFTGVSYYPQMVPLPKTRKRTGRGSSEFMHFRFKDRGERNYTEAYPTSILHFPQDRRDHIHPTQKPVALFDYLIRTYTQPGQLVLDHCAGSMTTAVAAIGCGRHFLCIEQDATYYAKGLQRVQHAQRGLWELAS